MIWAVLWVLSLLAVYGWGKFRTKRRTEELLALMERMRKRDYSIPMKQDEFSILEDRIYKIFMELVEEEEKTKLRSKRQREYLEDVAHQVKTPITNMLLAIENMEDVGKGSEEWSLFKIQVQRLRSLTDLILKLSSLDAKTDEMKREEVLLEELAEYSLEIAEVPKEIEVVMDGSLEGKVIHGDFYWLSEAVINILKNAVRLPKCTKLEIRSDSNPFYTSLAIKDNGGGISKEDLGKIFRRFYKTPDSDGFGIGLAMAKSIVERNNGVIEANNVEDGAEFLLKFYHVT